MVSAFQVGVSSAKKCSYSVAERGLPGVEAKTESWAGAADEGEGTSSTAGREQTDGGTELQNPLPAGTDPDWPQTGRRGLVRVGHVGVWSVGTPGAETKASLEEIREEFKSQARPQARRGLPEKRSRNCRKVSGGRGPRRGGVGGA